jgi:hypothetical protein
MSSHIFRIDAYVWIVYLRPEQPGKRVEVGYEYLRDSSSSKRCSRAEMEDSECHCIINTPFRNPPLSRLQRKSYELNMRLQQRKSRLCLLTTPSSDTPATPMHQLLAVSSPLELAPPAH